MAMRASTSSASVGSGGGGGAAGSSSRSRLSDAKSSPGKPVWRGAAPKGGITASTSSSSATFRSPAKAKTPTRTRNASGNRVGALSTSTSGYDGMLASPRLDPNVGRGQNMLLGTESDESALLGDGTFHERGLDGLSLLDSPDARAKPARASARLSASAKPKAGARISTTRSSRPSWGPRSSQGAATTSSSPSKGKMRLLEGVEDDDAGEGSQSQGRAQRTLGTMSYGNKGQQRARQSIFARPTQTAQTSSPKQARARTPSGKNGTTPQASPARDGHDQDVGETSNDSLYRSGNVKDRVAAIESNRQQQDVISGAASTLRKRASMGNGGQARESDEQLDAQLMELKRLNYIFESYESMLQAGTAQVDDFQQRIADTNALLDMYIDLMKQTERTQQLLMDQEWKGTTAEEEAMQALEAELAAREAQRRREQEEAEARAAAAAAAAAQERARKEEAACAAQRQPAETRASQATTRGGMAGRGASSIARGGSASTAARGTAARGGSTSGIGRGRAVSGPAGATARVAGTTRTASTAGATSSGTAPRSTSGGLNNRYANVRSSGYGPR